MFGHPTLIIQPISSSRGLSAWAKTLAAFLLVSVVSVTATQAQDPFAANIRETPKLSPEEEQKSFTLPPGFEMQLFAAEPQIAKPLNMAFDARGRLWVTNTIEYPFPVAPDKKSRDNIKILEDTDGDGRADKITTFAENLNIPIGIYPYEDGVIVFSIPYIWRLRDTDGDGKADKREKLFGPMGYERDTHGLNNAFRRGFDGWLYACHGFNNDTRVSGGDGDEIHMNSGNTYRMRLDGSRIEHFTWGQVNPFGMVIDELGNKFTADCHSKPIYQLLRGAYYPSFGKPHDGLGYVPPMMEHGHGSTAIAGIAVYDAPNFPKEYRGNIFTGNVMTSRVNRDSLIYHGSTILAHEEPDFVTTTDPWFRPVDIQLGPDGALYVADFYNRIIGHYEVPLDHPGRDRDSGRIWRIVYTGKDAKPVAPAPDLATASVKQLAQYLGSDNLTLRNLALNELADRQDEDVVTAARKALKSSTNNAARSRALWVLQRRAALAEEDLQLAATADSRVLRVHAMKALSETSDWNEALRSLAVKGLTDADPFVQRAAADALGQHPAPENLRPLLDLLPKIPEADNHLRQVVRIALRDQLRNPDRFAGLEKELSPEEMAQVAPLCLSLKTAAAGKFLADYLVNTKDSAGDVGLYLEHAARYAPPAETDRLARLAQSRFVKDLDRQYDLLIALNNGLKQRGVASSDELQNWSLKLAKQLLDATKDAGPTWTFHPTAEQPNSPNAFGVRQMPSNDGPHKASFFDSKAGGEHPTGILRSPSFKIPTELSFYLSGHDGFPDKPALGKNFVQLRDAITGETLKKAAPPRHDVARPVKWDLSKYAGRTGYFEIVDGINDGGYAWLAVGRFEPHVLSVPETDPAHIAQRQIAIGELVEMFQLKSLTPELEQLVTQPQTDVAARGRIAGALLSLKRDPRLTALIPAISDRTFSPTVRQQICSAIVSRDQHQIETSLADTFRTAPRRLQDQVAQQLAETPTGGSALLATIEAGKAPPQLLLNPAVQQRLAAAKIDQLEERIEQLTADLPPAAAEVEEDIKRRKQTFAGSAGDIEHGREVFKKQCSICHRVGELGKVVGPQLDGIGNRGVDRVLEDMLDPNRNVDVAFRTTILSLDSGKVVSGLLRREEGAVYVLVDNKGEEFTVPIKEVDERISAQTSLMPEGLTRDFSDKDFNDLLTFLLRQTAAEPAKKK